MPDQARSKNYPDGSRAAKAGLIPRPATAPAYYLGWPATFWLSVFGHQKRRAC
jgi:hypothetical protein